MEIRIIEKDYRAKRRKFLFYDGSVFCMLPPTQNSAFGEAVWPARLCQSIGISFNKPRIAGNPVPPSAPLKKLFLDSHLFEILEITSVPTGDDMTGDELKQWYLSLTDSSKQIFLAFVSNDLTIHGRGFGLDLPVEQQSRAFKGLNELQHQISGHIAGLGLGRDRYPDDVLWQILAETAAAYGLANHLKSSLERSSSVQVWELSVR
jgi:hypothetical protein